MRHTHINISTVCSEHYGNYRFHIFSYFLESNNAVRPLSLPLFLSLSVSRTRVNTDIHARTIVNHSLSLEFVEININNVVRIFPLLSYTRSPKVILYYNIYLVMLQRVQVFLSLA